MSNESAVIPIGHLLTLKCWAAQVKHTFRCSGPEGNKATFAGQHELNREAGGEPVRERPALPSSAPAPAAPGLG
jgi:hypothetical protein